MKKSQIRIVLVDDNEVVRSSLKLFIEAWVDFLLVGEAADGYEAISVCAQQQPDLILMDINMPVMNGIEATRIIRQRHPNVYILALSALGDNGNIQKILEVGANNFIPKQASVDDMAKLIRLTVDRNSLNSTV